MTRRTSISPRPAALLLLAGGVVFALVGWRVLALEQAGRERREARRSDLAVRRAKADADRLARAPRGRPLAAWTLEPANLGGVRTGNPWYATTLERLAKREATPERRLAAYDELLAAEAPTWVHDIAALRSGVVLNELKRFEASRRRLARAAEASPLLLDTNGERVRFAALRYLALDALGREDPAPLRRLLDEAQDGHRLAPAGIVGPARTLLALEDALARAGGRLPPGDRRRLEAARANAREGLRIAAVATAPGSVLLDDDRIAWRGDSRLAVFPLEALRETTPTDPDVGTALVRVPAGEALPAGARRLEAPLGELAVVPLPPPPLERTGLWLALALGVGLLAYAVGAGVALAGWRRSAQVAAQQAHFTAAVSHEMKTPIASVRAMAEMLADADEVDEARTRRYGARIDREMQRLGATVRNVLDAAHIERGTLPVHPEPGDVAALVERVVAGLRRPLEARGFELTLDLTPAAGPVPIDAAALEGVLMNLLDNAAKFSPEVRTIHVTGAPHGTGYRIAVLDRGVGLGSGDPEALFGRYNRGAAAREGAVPGIGLGLHIARQVVEAHGGRLTARARPRGGAAFEIDLPGGPAR